MSIKSRYDEDTSWCQSCHLGRPFLSPKWDFSTMNFLRDGFAAGRQIKESEAGEPLTEGKVRVKLDCNDEVIEVDEDDVEKANPPSFDRVEDLAQLRYLNESSVLHTLRQR